MKRQSNYQVYFADFETLTKNSEDYKRLGHTAVYLSYLESIDNEEGVYHNNIQDFINYLFNLGKSCLVYFHNLSFDGNFIIKYLIKNYPQQFIDTFNYSKEDLKKKDNYFSIFSNGRKIYNIKIHKTKFINGKKKKFNIEFKCTYNLLSSSISVLGKSLGYDKNEEFKELKKNKICNTLREFYDLGSFNMNNEVEYHYKKYIKKDVKIMKQSFINFKREIESNNYLVFSRRFKKVCCNVNNEMTIAALIYKISKNVIWNEYGKEYLKKYSLKSEDYDLCKNFYYGGYTQFNEGYVDKWLKNKSIAAYDINSSYPFQMSKLLPLGKLYPKINKCWKQYLEFYELEVESAVIKEKYYNFVILKNWKKENTNRYVRALYDFKCYYSKDEWFFIKKVYDVKVKKIKKWYSEADYVLKPIIENLHNEKLEADKLGNAAKKQTYKIALNSLYGTQCKRKEYETLFYTSKENYDKLKEQYKIDKNIIITKKYKDKEIEYKVIGFKNNRIYNSEYYGVYLMKTTEKNKYTNILIGAMITSYARLQLWNVIFNIGIDNWYYTDTDSVFINKNDKNYEVIHMDNYELGAWKEEFICDSGKILGAKRYVFINHENNKTKFGFSGVDIDFNNFDWIKLFNDKEVLLDGQQFIVEDDYGIYFDFRDYNLKRGGI